MGAVTIRGRQFGKRRLLCGCRLCLFRRLLGGYVHLDIAARYGGVYPGPNARYSSPSISTFQKEAKWTRRK
jgi:hypothetical protein